MFITSWPLLEFVLLSISVQRSHCQSCVSQSHNQLNSLLLGHGHSPVHDMLCVIVGRQWELLSDLIRRICVH